MTERILLSHGSGGRQTQELVRSLFAKHFTNPLLDAMGDAAILELSNGSRNSAYKLAFTTDSFVVQPLEFPGSDIGKLAVCGTVNDLAVSGARPIWLSCGFIIEEGFEVELLERIVASMAREACNAGVVIVCGDTKVVERGAISGLFINTSGIGEIVTKQALSPSNIKIGDKILINGFIADHGISILAARKELKLSTPVMSDCASLSSLTQSILHAAPNTRCMRDPTRGGVAATLNEWTDGASYGITLYETAIPICESTKAVCEMLGFDPLTVANEGKVLAAVPSEEADGALNAMQNHPLGKNAAIIGEVSNDHTAKVVMNTLIGTTRIIPMPSGELLPRIC